MQSLSSIASDTAPELPVAETFDTNPRTGAVNSAKNGIGRVEVIEQFLLVNNIGRNMQVFPLSDRGSDRSNSMLFNETSFPSEDEPSLLDLDMHAFLHRSKWPFLLAVNHFGTMRAFEFPPKCLSEGNIAPIFELQWLGDVERLLLTEDRLVSSSPRGHESDDPAHAGIMISAPLDEMFRQVKSNSSESDSLYRHHIQYHYELEYWGYITGVAVHHTKNLIAVVAEQHLGLFDLCRGTDNGDLLKLRWERELPFPIGWIRIHSDGSRIYAAGSGIPLSDVNFDDWDSIEGGGLLCLDVETGHERFRTTFDVPIAWGYGSVPLVLHNDGACIFAVDRAAGLHRIDSDDGSITRVYGPHPLASPSLGLAHLAQHRSTLYCGFNRGGHRLFTYSTAGN